MQKSLATAPALLNLGAVPSWPADILNYLKAHEGTLRGWKERPHTTSGPEYDRMIYGLEPFIAPYYLKGYHCTRLTRAEIDDIRRKGMGLPNGDMVERRVGALLAQGIVDTALAAKLAANHLYDQDYRRDRLYICFFEPAIAGEHGIGELLGCWGGEALYRGARSDDRLKSIGVPCLVEVLACIGDLRSNIALRISDIYANHLGLETEAIEFEDCTMTPIPAEHVLNIIEFPSEEFIRLTGCDGWNEPLKLGAGADGPGDSENS